MDRKREEREQEKERNPEKVRSKKPRKKDLMEIIDEFITPAPKFDKEDPVYKKDLKQRVLVDRKGQLKRSKDGKVYQPTPYEVQRAMIRIQTKQKQKERAKIHNIAFDNQLIGIVARETK
jgi:hypothetical protein